jgi:PAS domain S-box-containing protein
MAKKRAAKQRIRQVAGDGQKNGHVSPKPRKSKSRLQILSDASFEAIFLSEQGICIDQNLTAEKMFGYTLEEAVGRHGSEWIIPEDRERVKTKMRLNSAAPYDVTALRKDGTTFACEIQARHMDCDGRNIRVTALREISERQKSEYALKESEEKLRQIMENISDVVWLISFDQSRMLYVSPSYERIWGRSCQSLYDNPRGYIQTIHPGDKPAVLTRFRQYALTGRFDHSFRIVRPDGEVRWIHARMFPILDDCGEVVRHAGISTDITEEKLAGETLHDLSVRLRAILDHSPLLIAELNGAGLCLMANPAVGRFLGVGVSDLIGRKLEDFFQGHTVKMFKERIAQVMSTQRPLTVEDHLAIGKTEQHFITTLFPLFAPSGEARSIGNISLEITDLKRAESELVRANALLEVRANQLRALAGELTMAEQRERKRVSKVLHDGLQQNLASVRLQLAGLVGRQDAAPLMRELNEIDKVIAESIAMSRSLIADLSPPVLHDRGLGAGLKWLARRMKDKHGLNVALFVDDDIELPEDIKNLTFESVRELLFNIVKHAGAAHAQVRMQHSQESGMRITIRDEGVGFDPEGLKLAGDAGGGFGLFSISERIGLLGGTFEIDSAPGKGSCFVLTVPASHGTTMARGRDADRSARMVYAQKVEPILNPKEMFIRVLIADDHALFREGVTRLVNKEPDIGVVGQAANGREAIELARLLNPDVILMDINMPEVSGVEATRAIHRELPHIRIIGLSMHDDLEVSRAISAAGAVGYKNKGCAATELIAAIREGMKTGNNASSIPLQQG